MSSFETHHHFYLFALLGGGKRLAYGQNPEDALEVLSFWHTPEEMAQVDRNSCRRILQQDLGRYAHELA